MVVDVAESRYRRKLDPNQCHVHVHVQDPWEMQARTRIDVHFVQINGEIVYFLIVYFLSSFQKLDDASMRLPLRTVSGCDSSSAEASKSDG